MKILVHDYAGHPFQFELSSELGSRGHYVTHAFFAGDQGPKGHLPRTEHPAGGVKVQPIEIPGGYSKDNLARRLWLDRQYGLRLASLIKCLRSDVVLSGNTPPAAQLRALASAHRLGSGFVHWSQDVFTLAARDALVERGEAIAWLAGAYAKSLEQKIHRRADATVAAAKIFANSYAQHSLPFSRGLVLPNWGALSGIRPTAQKAAAWREEQGLSNTTILLFSGTLGSKHCPELLIELARKFAARKDVAVVIATNKRGQALLRRLDPNLNVIAKVLPLQPIAVFNIMLGAADILVATLSRSASQYSVPSKIWSYMCAGKPILLAACENNDAAEVLRSVGCGCVVAPEDASGWLNTADQLVSSPILRDEFGKKARGYAEQNFDIRRITDRFEAVLEKAAARQQHRRSVYFENEENLP